MLAGKWFGRWWRLSVIIILGSLPLSSGLASGSWLGNAPDEAWASPSVPALKAVGTVAAAVDPALGGNFDCTELTYRMIDDLTRTMHRGCFITTAFGLFNYSDQIIIFNGSSEGEAVHANAGATTYLPLPYSADVAALGGFPAAGSYLQLYTYFPTALSDELGMNLQPYKQVATDPNLTLKDNSGQPIAINPGALAYSSRGQWLISESPGHGLLRVNSATLSLLPFGAPLPSTSPSPTALAQAQLTISDDGRYAAVADSAVPNFMVYDLASCHGDSRSDELAPQQCSSHDYWSYLQDRIAGLGSVSRLRFLNDGLLSFEAQTVSGTVTYELAPSGQITSLISYLGLGDSYSSGEGAFDYLDGTDTATNKCHLSSHSYPLLLSQDLFSSGGHNVACSGATISDIGSTAADYDGQTTDKRPVSAREADGSANTILSGFSPGYLAQQAFVRQYQPGVITVGVGGNDIGFGDILLRCVGPNDCYSSYEDRLELTQTIGRTYQKWTNLYAELRQAAPDARIYATGYPQLAVRGNCALNVHLSGAEIDFSQDLINYLNGVIAAAARTAGVNYIDVGQAFAGHRLCETNGDSLALNGLTAGHDAFGVIGHESYHPTALGQELLEQTILRAAHNFTNPNPTPAAAVAPPTVAPTDPILDAPVSGRPINTVIPDDSITADSAGRGHELSITVSGLADGLRPGSLYTISLSDGTVLGSLTADGNGNLSGSLTVPTTASDGIQTIFISGQGTAGGPIIITKVIYVQTSGDDADGDDADGDGLTNDQNSCPVIKGSGIDADKDGVDDACDSAITATGENGGQTPGNDFGSNNQPVVDQPADFPPNSSALGNEVTATIVAPLKGSAATLSSEARWSAGPSPATSPQVTSAVLGDHTRLRSVAPPVTHSGGTPVYAPLPVINWPPWAIGGSLLIISLLLLSAYTGQNRKWAS